ncbi:hypothetical protein HYV89_05115 [Candidatus Woesearchaeota archaeon]|nr:hypothetical protein [Candidatus Woesearchaeota archaeon]
MYWWIIFVIIDVILLSILINIFWWCEILDFIDKRTNKTRDFIKTNEGFFSVLFIISFAFEQAILIGLTTYFKEDTTKLRLIIGIFALVVMTTASLQKFILETKRRYENETKESLEKSNKVIVKLRKVISNYKEKIKDLENGLSKEE